MNRLPELIEPWRALTDIDARATEDQELAVHHPIEFATFCEGEYVESFYVTRRRAMQICVELGLLTGLLDKHLADAMLEEIPSEDGDA